LKRALSRAKEMHLLLPADLYEALRERAAAEGVPVSALVRRLLRSCLG